MLFQELVGIMRRYVKKDPQQLKSRTMDLNLGSFPQVGPRHPVGLRGADAFLGLPPPTSRCAGSGPVPAAVPSARYKQESSFRAERLFMCQR